MSREIDELYRNSKFLSCGQVSCEKQSTGKLDVFVIDQIIACRIGSADFDGPLDELCSIFALLNEFNL